LKNGKKKAVKEGGMVGKSKSLKLWEWEKGGKKR